MAGMQRKGSAVVHLRVDPIDVMACVDAARLAGMIVPGMSLASVIRAGVMAMAETLRGMRVLPEREGWEYNEMVTPYQRVAISVKAHTARAITGRDVERDVHDLPRPAIPHGLEPRETAPGPPTMPTKALPPLSKAGVNRLARLLRQEAELVFRKREDPENFTEGQEKELAVVRAEIAILRGGR